MKRITTLLILSFLFGSAFSQMNANQKLEQLNTANLLQQYKKAKKQQPSYKALSFDNAYYTLEYDTTALLWDSIKRTTQYVDYNINKPNSVKFSLLNEEYNGQFYVKKDSMVAYIDTTQPFKHIIHEDFGTFDSIKMFSYDSANASWVLFVKSHLVINANKVTAAETYFNLAAFGIPGGTITLFNNTDFYYNSSNHLTHWVESSLNFGTGSFDAEDSVVVTTASNGYRLTDEYYEWTGSSWDPTEKYSYTYNLANMTSKIRQDYYNNTFNNSEKNKFSYNAAGDVLVDSLYTILGSAWKLSGITVNTYTSFGDNLNKSEYFISNNNPYLYSKSDYYYNSNNRRDSVVKQSKNIQSPSATLWNNEKEIYRYSPFPKGGGTATSPAAPTNLTVIPSQKSPKATMLLSWTDNSNNELGFIIERSLNNVNWTSIDSTSIDVVIYTDTNVASNTTYYYRVIAYNAVGSSSYSNTSFGTSLNVGIETIQKNSFSVYPNPVSSILKIQEKNSNKLFHLLDLNGKTIKTFQVNGYYELNLESLSNGIYFLKSNTEVIKVVKH
ncbi:MAG: T9SS C-terminal target domain-containing protein [Bacteroidetes bacterium]|nr:MAG: T9SS C-terminal target domain-containing protein [Bacteroidota bacterium]MBL1145870.1 T9SS C-terminal target domain-containing protein [Bacteroidota bacterium]NOG58664.1 T9SS type A sorting domain-containing protein [Bacteroidota bacterium]